MVFNAHSKDFFVEDKDSKDGKRFLSLPEVKAQIRENIGHNVEELEFSDFIVNAIDETKLFDNDRLATAFKYFDNTENWSLDASKILNALDQCMCDSLRHPACRARSSRNLITVESQRCKLCKSKGMRLEIAHAIMS